MSQAQIAHIDVDLYLHVRVLISIVLGLSIARLVGGVASLIHPVPYRVSLIHLGWVAWTLLNVLAFWWWEFRLRLIENWTLGLYVFVCLYASMYYFLSALLFSDHVEGHEGYLDYFLSRRIWFFGFAGLTEALDVVDTWIKGADHLRSLGPEYFVHIGVFVVLCGIAAWTRNRTFHAFFVVISLAYEVSYLVRYYYTVS